MFEDLYAAAEAAGIDRKRYKWYMIAGVAINAIAMSALLYGAGRSVKYFMQRSN